MTITLELGFGKENVPTFAALEKEIFTFVTDFGCQILQQILEEQDNILRKDRDRTRYRCKGKRKTSIKTRLGVVEYWRNVYQDAEREDDKRCVYLLDRQLSLDTMGLISSEICVQAVQSVCESSYRAALRQISETTGLFISPQGVWLKLQGKDRKESGPSKEMKVGIAYDGVLWSGGKDGKQRRKLDNKVSYASFESVSDFRRHKEGIIANRFLVDEIQQRILNGDGAGWLQKRRNQRDILVLDKFHRNKKITECVKNQEFAQVLRELLYANRIDDLLTCIEAQINSIQDEGEIEGLRKLLGYYTENKASLTGYYERGVDIPETRAPGTVHHARLGNMESNVFTLIGNRMKDRRCCWSIAGANHLAGLLCLKHTTGFEDLFLPLPPPPKPEAQEEEASQRPGSRRGLARDTPSRIPSFRLRTHGCTTPQSTFTFLT